jgi:hypothetical protein
VAAFPGLPVLAVVFILQILGALNLEWSLLANLGLLAAAPVPDPVEQRRRRESHLSASRAAQSNRG